MEYENPAVGCVAGRVIQPWDEEKPQSLSYRNNNPQDPDNFLFNSAEKMFIRRFMGGNVSFRRELLVQCGGFDENFVKVAYRFEAECASRFVAAGNTIFYSPDAAIHHLKVPAGGTREYGEHLTTARPAHSVGRYYYLLVTPGISSRLAGFLGTPFSSVTTRFHLARPWWIPVTLFAELTGMAWALVLKLRGPRLLPGQE
jgi:GT2 family glycosyltransferase